MIKYYKDRICLDREEVTHLIESIENIRYWNESLYVDNELAKILDKLEMIKMWDEYDKNLDPEES